jgi:phosphotransacetylase
MVRRAYEDVRWRMDADTTGRWASVRVTPEIQFAPAVLEGAAQQKLDMSDPVNAAAGKCSVLIAPTLDVGNLLFHLHVAYFRGSSYVLIPAGFKWHSAVDFSRSSKVDDIVLAAAAASARIQKTQGLPPVITL